jgi:anti-sigma factor RsiW
MNCQELRECVAPLLDGELDAHQEAAAAEHLDSCEACAALVERLAAVPIRPVPQQAPANPAFWDAMDQALDAEAGRAPGTLERVRGWLRGELRISRGMAVAYLVLLLAAFAWHLTRPDPPPPLQSIADPAGQQEGAPRPAAKRSGKLERASYTPVQQTF